MSVGWSRESKPLDTGAVAALCACNIAHFFTICSLFSYAGFLAVDNGWANDEDSGATSPTSSRRRF